MMTSTTYVDRSKLVTLGFSLLSVTNARLNLEKQSDPLILKRAQDFVKKHPNIIFSSTGRGMHSDRITISIHKDYADYCRFTREIEREYGEFCTVTETFLVSLESDQILRPLSLATIGNRLKGEKTRVQQTKSEVCSPNHS